MNNFPIVDFYNRKVFTSWKNASDNGFFSKSYWSKLKKRPNVECSAIVCLDTVVQKGLSFHPSIHKDISPIISCLNDNQFLLAKSGKWFPVFCVDQAVEKSSKKSIISTSLKSPVISSNSSSLSSFFSSPLVSTEVEEIAFKSLCGKELKVNNRPRNAFSENEEKEDEKTKENWAILDQITDRKYTCYVPESWHEEMGDLKDETYSFLHLMRVYHLVNHLDDDDFVDMSWYDMRERIPNFERLMKQLKRKKLIEITKVLSHPLGFEIPRGLEGLEYGIHKAYGYRLTSRDYRKARWTKRPIYKKSIFKKLEDYENCRLPVHKWLRNNLRRLETVSTHHKALKLIRDRTWLYKVDKFAQRCHSNATAIKRDDRAALRVDGQPLVEIDIACAQLLFLAIEAKKQRIEGADRFIELCQADIYQHLADLGGLSREQVKEELCQRALFSSNRSKHQKLITKQLFDAELPQISQWFRKIKSGKKTKDNPKPHNKLAKLAQRAEAKFVIETVCDRFRTENKEMWIGTIHDAVLCLAQDVDYVRMVINDEFSKAGVKPKLKEVNYASS